MAKSHRREAGDRHELRKTMRDEQEKRERKQRRGGRTYYAEDLEEEDADLHIPQQEVA